VQYAETVQGFVHVRYGQQSPRAVFLT